MKKAPLVFFVLFLSSFTVPGCSSHQARPGITAVGLSPNNRCDPGGIPYYLPKPLLVVAKNVRHIDESKTGLSGPVPIPGGFDNQAAYADIKANVTVPGSDGMKAANINPSKQPDAAAAQAMLPKELDKSFVPEHMMPGTEQAADGVQPDTFFTYQIVFVPDLTQKYGLRITGGAGEIRAAMNMVNGWMYTGMGPYYMKDSSSAQNAMATGAATMFAGRGVSSVLDSVGNLATTIGKAASGKESALSETEMLELSEQISVLQSLAVSTPKIPKSMTNYAEIYIYEPLVEGDQTQWQLVAEHHFDRDYLTASDTEAGQKARQAIFDMLLKKASSGSGTAPGSSATGAPSSPNAGASAPAEVVSPPPSATQNTVPPPANSVPQSSSRRGFKNWWQGRQDSTLEVTPSAG